MQLRSEDSAFQHQPLDTERARRRPSAASVRGACRPTPPPLRLALAVLDDAVRIVLAGREGRNQSLWFETVEWLLSNDTCWVFAFQNICDLLDLSGDRLRANLRPWTKVRAAIPPANRPSLLVGEAE